MVYDVKCIEIMRDPSSGVLEIDAQAALHRPVDHSY